MEIGAILQGLRWIGALLISLTHGAVQDPPTEVVFVGTHHFITDMPAGFTPGHLRVLLTKINPSLLAVEAPAGVKNPWEFAPLELQWVTKPWAESRKIPLAPVGWTDPWYSFKLQTMAAELQKAGNGEAYQRLEAQSQGELSSVTSCEAVNGERGIDLWRQYHLKLHDIYGKETPWEAWNGKIVENLKSLIRDNRGRRVAIVYGAAHGYFLLDAVAKEERVKVLSCSSFFPISPKEVVDHTVPRDHLLALRMLNFGGLPPDKIEEFEKRLDVVKGLKEYSGDYDLFTGKFLLIKGDLEGALIAFRKAAALGDETLSAFDGVSRLNEAGEIYGAIALGRQGKAKEAQDQLKTVLKKESISAPMKQWAQQILKELEAKK